MISFIYFDLGGVMIDDFSGNGKWQSMREEIGISEDKAELFKDVWTKYEPELCTTRDVETMVKVIEDEVGANFPHGFTFMNAFIERFDSNKLIWPIVQDISAKTKVGLLTNIYPNMLDKVIEKGILPDVKWDQVVDSSMVGVRKPDPKIFEVAQEKAGVPHDQILFIDNKKENTDAGNALGWQTFFYDSSNHEKSSHDLEAFLAVQQFTK